MAVDDRLTGSEKTKRRGGEIILSGRAVSRGVAVGKIVCLDGARRQFFRVELADDKVRNELRRLRLGVALADKQLHDLTAQNENGGDIKAGIFGAHRLILGDSSLIAKIEKVVERQKINAEWAIKIVAERSVADYKRIGDEHLRERYIDLKDVLDRLLNALGAEKQNLLPAENAVVVAGEIKPSTLIELSKIKPKAIVTETGGWTSHTFILAREMNLPAVTGIKNILRLVETGDEAVVDGYEGKIIVNPKKRTLREYETTTERLRAAKRETYVQPTRGTLKTLDGREIIIRANVDSPVSYEPSNLDGARGVGLYRSEFLFNRSGSFPGDAEQIATYRAIADAAGADGARIRTFDLNLEQTSVDAEKESNPALGLRAIRLGLSDSKQLRRQLSAILQASANRKIDVLLPMISDVSEIDAVKRILEEEKERLKKSGIEFGVPLVGAMIEVPAAILMIEEIARSVDFLSLGTNDLVQYLLAVDRDNPAVADWFRTLHPAVIRAIKTVLTAAANADKQIVVCGEMAGSPFYAPVLIGLGATDLSMNVNSIERVGRIVRGIACEEARELAARIERCATADEAEEAAGNYFAEKWSHLYTPDVLPANTRTIIERE